MKLWDKGTPTNHRIHAFTSGNDRELDVRLARYDVLGSMAHAKMLASVGLLSKNEVSELLQELEVLLERTKLPDFSIPEEFEDIHSYVEYLLTEKLGESGKKIHTARSRNDQVLVDIHLYVRDALKEISENVVLVAEALLSKAEETKDVFMPGYTHMQVAMPSSFGLWFSAWAESLSDDLIHLSAARRIADQNPLGSAAGYGSSFPIDREFTTRELGFSQMRVNSIAAQFSRGKLEMFTAQAIASVAHTLSRFCMDVVLYMGQNFGFFTLPDEYTTGSSIMPHKKNPDVFELTRARCNQLQTLPEHIRSVVGNLPAGYHRDFQELKEPLFNGIDMIMACLEMVEQIIPLMNVNTCLADDDRYKLIGSVDRVAEFVQAGDSFREAYKKVGLEINSGTYQPQLQRPTTHEGSVGNLMIEEIRRKVEKGERGLAHRTFLGT